MQFIQPRSAASRRCLSACFLLGLLVFCATETSADFCPSQQDEIATDRPDVTNSGLVAPVGSFQSENGVNLSVRGDGRTFDGTNTRWRLGAALCLEMLVDLPTYLSNTRAPGVSGFTDVAPAVKWQISLVSGRIDLSVVLGVALPTGVVEIAGRGTQPYLQLPWSWELNDSWGLSGMLTEFFPSAEPATRRMTETTFAVEKKLTETASLFAEYIGDYPEKAGPAQFINSGGLYRLSRTRQLDLHLAFGLKHNSPVYIVGVGYSFRLDELFRQSSFGLDVRMRTSRHTGMRTSNPLHWSVRHRGRFRSVRNGYQLKTARARGDSLRCKSAPGVATELSELWLDHVCVVETSRIVMDGMYRRSVHAGRRVADFERQSLDVLRTAWVAVPLARAYPGETPAQDRAEIAAAQTRSRTPMRHM
jgi:hypothetical protein